MSHTPHARIQFGRLKSEGVETYFAFLAFSALIFAHRAFDVLDIFARTAADIVLLAGFLFGLLEWSADKAVFPPPFNATMALLTAVN
jgi:hypothetical protein